MSSDVAPSGPRIAVKRLGLRARLWITRLVLERRYAAPPEFTRHLAPEELDLPMELWDDGMRHMYAPSPLGSLGRILRPAEVSPDDVFIDFGCGTGRILMEAADRYPFRRVIGVDFVPRLTDIARDVLERNRARLRCRSFEVVCTDVLSYEVPDDVTYAYLFDPFKGEVLDAVLDKLIASFDRNPRRLRILYFSPAQRHQLERTGRIRFVRYGRRLLRRWSPAPYVAMFELGPETGR